MNAVMSLLREDLRFAMLPEPRTIIMTTEDAVDGAELTAFMQVSRPSISRLKATRVGWRLTVRW